MYGLQLKENTFMNITARRGGTVWLCWNNVSYVAYTPTCAIHFVCIRVLVSFVTTDRSFHRRCSRSRVYINSNRIKLLNATSFITASQRNNKGYSMCNCVHTSIKYCYHAETKIYHIILFNQLSLVVWHDVNTLFPFAFVETLFSD